MGSDTDETVVSESVQSGFRMKGVLLLLLVLCFGVYSVECATSQCAGGSCLNTTSIFTSINPSFTSIHYTIANTTGARCSYAALILALPNCAFILSVSGCGVTATQLNDSCTFNQTTPLWEFAFDTTACPVSVTFVILFLGPLTYANTTVGLVSNTSATCFNCTQVIAPVGCILPMTTQPLTTLPITTIPLTTVAQTTVALTTTPLTTLPVTTTPLTTTPLTTVGLTTVGLTTLPLTTTPHTTVAHTTIARTTALTLSTMAVTTAPPFSGTTSGAPIPPPPQNPNPAVVVFVQLGFMSLLVTLLTAISILFYFCYRFTRRARVFDDSDSGTEDTESGSNASDEDEGSSGNDEDLTPSGRQKLIRTRNKKDGLHYQN